MSVEVKSSVDINRSFISNGDGHVTTPEIEKTLLQTAHSTSFSSHEILSGEAPFAGIVGWLFMRACWLVELFEGWAAKSSRRERLESAVTKKFGSRVAGWLSSLIAAACCTLAALCVLPLFWAHSLHPLAPLFFLLVISYIAMRFGDIAGVVGTIGAAFVFAFFLFEPSGLAVSSPIERNRLISMIIIGLLVSELLGRRKPHAVYKP